MKKYYKSKDKHKQFNRYINSERRNILLTYMTIILAMSQIFNIVYVIASNLYSSVDKLLRKFIMYVLLELPLTLISIYISVISISCILKVVHSNFIKDRKKLLEEYNDNKEKILKEVAKTNVIEILTIIILPITTYISIETLVFAYNFKETKVILWIMIIILFSIFSFVSLICICGSKTNVPIFSNDYSNLGNKVNWIYDNIILYMLPNKIIYLIPIFINIFLIFSIKSIDIYFTNYEKELAIHKIIENDKEIKYEIIVDKLLDKIGINITDEDIKEYKKHLKEKYKMEE